MLIRCEKCSTLYELDDKLLPPQGAPVQCSKCQFVFKAYPAPPPPRTTRAANDAPDEVPGDPAPSLEAVPPRTYRDEFVREGGALANKYDDAPVPPSASSRSVGGVGAAGHSGAGSSGASPAAAGSDEQRFTADGRPIRKVPFPAGDLPQVGPRTPPLPSAGKQSAGRRVPPRWVIVAIVALAIVVGVALGWRALGGHGDGAPAGQSRPLPQGGTPEAPARK